MMEFHFDIPILYIHLHEKTTDIKLYIFKQTSQKCFFLCKFAKRQNPITFT